MPTFLRLGISAFGLIAFGGQVATAADEGRFFREKIEPVLVAECYRCHFSKAPKLKGGLALDSRSALIRGGDGGPAIVPGKSGESPLIQALRHEDGMAMPPKSPKLAEAIVADFASWVDRGAFDPREDTAPVLGPPTIKEARRTHWAFQPIRRPNPPKGNETSRNPIDGFVREKLDDKKWPPAPPIGKRE